MQVFRPAFDDKRWWASVIDRDLNAEDLGALHSELRISEIESWGWIPRYRRAQQEQRAYVYVRDRGRCHYCHALVDPRSMHADHMVSYRAGGLTLVENLACACKRCNYAKGSCDADSFIADRLEVIFDRR